MFRRCSGLETGGRMPPPMARCSDGAAKGSLRMSGRGLPTLAWEEMPAGFGQIQISMKPIPAGHVPGGAVAGSTSPASGVVAGGWSAWEGSRKPSRAGSCRDWVRTVAGMPRPAPGGGGLSGPW